MLEWLYIPIIIIGSCTHIYTKETMAHSQFFPAKQWRMHIYLIRKQWLIHIYFIRKQWRKHMYFIEIQWRMKIFFLKMAHAEIYISNNGACTYTVFYKKKNTMAHAYILHKETNAHSNIFTKITMAHEYIFPCMNIYLLKKKSLMYLLVLIKRWRMHNIP
jgi:hypothetical protein